ncbi:DNA-directed RNA polymerase I subunit RPA1-like protein [Corchorus capsularis]|uniref:DNA-directed RNA polymerase I subunit RPA1-like protein n=1 Tax=Corchorus capsularis TaxID=210143 RepID=A0A1R3G9Q0_COCAP|nr:DNA-directed RNA polymerase I subunit RPA1-like protein [Corchorus capsularis]
MFDVRKSNLPSWRSFWDFPLEIVPDAKAANGYAVRTGDVISVNVGSRIARPYVMSNDGRILFWAKTGMGVLHVVRTDLNTSDENRHFSVMLEDYTDACLLACLSSLVLCMLMRHGDSLAGGLCNAPSSFSVRGIFETLPSDSIMEASFSSLSTFFFREILLWPEGCVMVFLRLQSEESSKLSHRTTSWKLLPPLYQPSSELLLLLGFFGMVPSANFRYFH